MKFILKTLAAGTAAALLLASPAAAVPADAWSQLGFTIELSSGDLTVTPAGTLNTADARSSAPTPGHASNVATDGYAFATAGPSTGTSLSLNTDNYFLVDAFASTEGGPGVSGAANATALSFYDLSFTNVLGPTVTLTLTPLFYSSLVPSVGVAPGLVYGYVSAFLSLGSASFVSFQSFDDSAGYADFAPLVLTVGANETVQLNLAVTAGLGVPETSGSFGLLGVGLVALLGLHRKFRAGAGRD